MRCRFSALQNKKGAAAERSFWPVAPTDLYRLQRVRVAWNLLRGYSDRQPSLFVHEVEKRKRIERRPA